MADTRTDQKKAEDAQKILNVLAQIRQPYEAMVDEILTFVNHSRRKIKDRDNQRGQKTGIEVYDGTALSALNLLTDGMCGYSVSKSYRWFNYTLPGKLNFPRASGMRAWSGKRMDELQEVKQWLEDCEEVLYSAFIRSNFYDVIPEIVRDAASVGTANVLIEEDVNKGRTVLTVPHFRESYIAEDRYGMVDTRYRIYPLTLRQLLDKFGEGRMREVFPDFKGMMETNPHQERQVLHAVYPRRDYDYKRVDAKNMPIESLWVMMAPLKLLGELGYEESPLMTWRWRKNNDEVYGRSPAWDCYVDIMKGNQQAKTNLIAAHKMADPPMVGPEDLRGQVNKGPGAWSFVSSNLMEKHYPRPLVTGMQLPFSIDQQERTDKAIKEHFHVDFFLMLAQAAANKVEMTATQVMEMGAEKAAILGVRIGRQETELLNPLHDRFFSIERKSGRLPDPPDVLVDFGGNNIEIDYLGPLAQAQKRIFKSAIIRASIQSLGEIATIYPDVVYTVDPMKTARDLLDSQGFPQKNFRTDEEIKQILEVKHQQEDEQRKFAQAIEIAKQVPKVGKAVEPNSPLSALTGGGMEGQA